MRILYPVILCAWLGPALAFAEAPGAAISNEVVQLKRQSEQADQQLLERIKALETKVAQLSQQVGERRGSERVDTMSEDLREIRRQLDKLNRDVDKLEQSVSRLERR